MTDRLANRIFGLSFLNPKMLCVGLDNSSPHNFVIGINCIKRRFHRTIWSLKNNLAFLVPPDVLQNMRRGVLQPILRPARVFELCLLKVHNLFCNPAGSKNTGRARFQFNILRQICNYIRLRPNGIVAVPPRCAGLGPPARPFNQVGQEAELRLPLIALVKLLRVSCPFARP